MHLEMTVSRRFLLFAAAVLLASGRGGPLPGQNAEPPRFTESIEVREIEVIFDDDVLPRLGSFQRKKLDDFSALEAGASHPLVEIGSVAAEDWVHVLYFDSLLAAPAARAAAARALGRIAEELTAGGRAEIVVADPLPRIVTATGIPATLVRALDQIAANALGEIESGPRLPSTTAVRCLQLDRLMVEIAGRGGGGPRALWLAADGWPLSPVDHARFSQVRQRGVTDDPQFRSLLASGRVLASYGWVTFPVALRDERPTRSPRTSEERVQSGRGGTGGRWIGYAIFTLSRSRTHPDATAEAQLETLTDFALLPLAELSRPTSGTLIGIPERLVSAMGDLHDRRRAIYRGPRPDPGTLAPLEVRWTGGDGRALPSPRFLRSSTPEEVTLARLRSLLAGDSPPSSPVLIALRELASSPGAREICFGSGSKRTVRLSFAGPGSPGEERFDVPAPRVLADQDSDRCLLFAPTGVGPGTRFAWVAEDLDNETWTGGIESQR